MPPKIIKDWEKLPRNTNCLEGIECPRCGSLGPFRISGEAVFIVNDDGCDEFSSLEWDDDSRCSCTECEAWGKIKDFKIKEKNDE